MANLSHVTEYGISSAPREEFQRRLEKVRAVMEEKNLDSIIFFSADAIFYLTGSPLIQTERPIALIYTLEGKQALLVPRLELEHAESYLPNCCIACYPEYPGERHPMYFLADLLKEMNLDGRPLGADSDGYPPVYGYSGPSLTQVPDRMEVTLLPRLIQSLKVVKSDYELDLMRESSRWSNYALELLREYTKPGLKEYDVSFRAGNDGAQAMLKTLGPRYRPSALTDGGVLVGYRGQIGTHSYYPHAVTTNAMFRRKDMLGAYSSANIMGYSSELERNFFLGEPTKEQQKYYELVLRLQETALAAIRPGALCSDVDRAAKQFFQEHDIMDAWRHHTGHSLGSGMHENPVFDVGDHTVLEAGMCFSVEPGIYVKGVGGFRLSDTVAIHEDGVELITYYSRNLENLIIDC